MMRPPDSSSLLRHHSAVDAAEWAELLRGSPDTTPFQDPRFAEIYARHRAGATPAYLELRDGDGVLIAGLPFVQTRRGPFVALSSAPAGGYGGPVGADTVACQRLVDEYMTFGGTRVLRREMTVRSDAFAKRWPFRSTAAGVIPLEGGYEGFLKSVFPRNRRNECNRSERRGLEVVWSKDEEHVARVHAIYVDMSRTWKQTVLPLAFWCDLLVESPEFLLSVALENGEVVGGHLCCELESELFVWMGTTLRRKQTFPSALLIREEARYAADRGFGCLNLGSSRELDGVASYKRLLGATTRSQWYLLQEAWPLRGWRVLRRSPA